MRTILIFCSFLLTSPAWPAALPATPWQKLGQRLVQPQNFSKIDGLYILTSSDPADQARTHQASYLETDKVHANPDGTFQPAVVISIEETWTRLADGDWDIDQWVRTADANGVLVDLTRKHMVETDYSAMKEEEIVKTGKATDAGEIARWNAVLERWYAL